MSDNNDSLVGEFLEECREHLANIESDLLSMEAGGADIDEQLVNKVFRAAHSIKGGAGFFALAKIQDLAHRTENVLDMVRSREMVPTPEVINILLLAFDRLTGMIDHHEQSNDEDISEIVVALSGLASSFLPPSEKESLEQDVVVEAPEANDSVEIPAFDLTRIRRDGKTLYLIKVDLIHDVQARGKSPLDLLRLLLQDGWIVDAQLDLATAGTLDDEPSHELVLRVLYATDAEAAEVAARIEVPVTSVIPTQAVESAEPESLEPAETHEGDEDVPEARIIPMPVPEERQAPRPAAKPTPTSKPASATANRKTTATESTGPDAAKSNGPEGTLRVPVGLLESLMNLAGELVLGRNQLNDAIARGDLHAIRAGGQRLSLVTSELQEAVMLTRMQPIGNLFGKFPRLVRDLSRELGKDVKIEITGREVELDKTLLEGLGDPLTHMVRNAVDHGIEPTDARIEREKSSDGTVRLRAYHEAGQVVIEIEDDGKGIDADKIADVAVTRGLVTREQVDAMSAGEKRGLIFMPGLSTAERVTDVSGRGVGMDVVKTNLDRLGGTVEIDSILGRGTTFRIKLPLTLAIIPSLLVSVGEERFAVPQVNVSELLRIPAAKILDRIELVGDAEVIILRNQLIPLVELSAILGSVPTEPGRLKERYSRLGADLKVVVVSAGTFVYGLVVDELHDNLEIVVKPLGRRLKGLREYAGATILGDGCVALILDATGIASVASLSSLAGTDRARDLTLEAQRQETGEAHALLVFDNGPEERCAVPLSFVKRVERIEAQQIEWVGGRRTMQYRDASLPLIALSDIGAGQDLGIDRELVVIVLRLGNGEIGLVAAMPVDVLETRAVVDTTTLRGNGIIGSALIRGRTTLIVDVLGLVQAAWPGWDPVPPDDETAPKDGDGPLVLLAEDSDFFRKKARLILEEGGYRVVAAEDGQAAWETLERIGTSIVLVVTDIEMPRLDGLSLTRRIRGDTRYARLPVVTLSSLAGEDDIARAKAVGVDAYNVKLDKDALLESIRSLLGESVLAA
jgi:two-component system, chemotaxis family, sensor kinase CheA